MWPAQSRSAAAGGVPEDHSTLRIVHCHAPEVLTSFEWRRASGRWVRSFAHGPAEAGLYLRLTAAHSRLVHRLVREPIGSC